jgi:intein/homing endonuclease
MTCSLYWGCKDLKKGRSYSCKSFKKLKASGSESLELDLSETNEAKAGRIAQSSSGFSSLTSVPEITEDDAFKQELKLEKIWNEVLKSNNRVPPDLKIDDRDLKEYPNFFTFVTDKDGLGNVGVPFARQLWFITSLLSEACGNPKCTSDDWWDVEKVPLKVDSLHDLLEIVTFYEYGVCPKCKGRKSKHYKKKLIRRVTEGFGCITGDALVSTKQGLLRLDSLSNREGIKVNSGTRLDTMYQFLVKGTKPVYSLETLKGYRVEGTQDHQIQILNRETLELEWIELGKLRKGDLLCVSTKPTFVTRKLKLELPTTYVGDHKTKKLDRPKYMTPDLAKLLGYVLSDGSIGGDGFAFINTNKTLHADVQYLTEKLFGHKPQYETNNVKGSEGSINGVNFVRTKNSYRTTLYSKQFWLWAKHMGIKQGSLNLEIPWVILQADHKSQAAFLAAFIEGDGSIFPNRIAFYSKSKTALRQIQILLQSWGIISTTVRNNGTLNVCGDYCVDLYEKIKPYLVHKKAPMHRSKKPTASDIAGIPNKSISNLVKERRLTSRGCLYEDDSGNQVKNIFGRKLGFHHGNKTLAYRSVQPELVEILGKISKSLAKKINALVQAGYYFDPIFEKKYEGKKPVYDINVRERHSFTANGIVVHNCVGQRAGKSVTLSMLAAYVLHRYLKMQSPTMAFGLLKGSVLSAAFVALTHTKAVNLLWNPISNMIMDSKWFQQYHELLEHYENKFGIKIFQRPGGAWLHYRHRDLMLAPSGPSKRTLRGDTRFFYIIDEAGLFPIEGNVDDKERMSIFETATSLKNSTITIRSAAKELFRQGYDNVPTSLGVYISSPMSQRDFIMRGVKENADNRRALVLHLPSWKFNPTLKEKDLRREFKNDPVKFERDFGANPPLSESTFIDLGENAEKVFSGAPNKIDYVYKVKKDPRQRLKQKWAEPVNMRAGWNAPPTIMALDAGAVNNSFALSIGHPVKRQHNRREWTVGIVDAIIEVAPTHRQSEINFNRLCTKLLFQVIEKFNVGAVVTDRWQNLKLLDDLMEKYNHLVTETYSLTYEDCVTFKEQLLDEQPKIIMPRPERSFDEIDIIDTSLNYPNCFKYMPIAHTYFQLKTVQDNGLKIDKGPGFTDDCLRSTMLLTTFLHDQDWCKNNLKAQKHQTQQVAQGGYVAGRSIDSPVQSLHHPNAAASSPSVGVGASRGGIMTNPIFRR